MIADTRIGLGWAHVHGWVLGVDVGMPGLTVLVVDDSPTMRRVAEIVVGRLGHRVITSATGMAALAALAESSPNLIVVDATLPHVDGYDVCHLLRRDARTRGVPVILLFERDGLLHKLKRRLAGATASLAKPFRPRELAFLVERHLAGVS